MTEEPETPDGEDTVVEITASEGYPDLDGVPLDEKRRVYALAVALSGHPRDIRTAMLAASALADWLRDGEMPALGDRRGKPPGGDSR